MATESDSVRFEMKMPPEMMAVIEAIAKRLEVSAARVVRIAIQEFIDRGPSEIKVNYDSGMIGHYMGVAKRRVEHK